MARTRKGDRKVLHALLTLSERVGALYPNEVVKAGNFDLPNAFELIEVAEANARVSPVDAEQLRLYIRKKWIGYTTDELPRNNALISRDFAPSYAAYTRSEYETRVQGARKRAALDAEGYHSARDKREAHYGLPGGRQGLRYPEERRMASRATEARLKGMERPFDARTQAPKTRRQDRDVPRARPNAAQTGPTKTWTRDYETGRLSYPERVRQALGKLTEGRFKWTVPADVDVLVQAGMPRKEATILVRRAANRSFLVEDLTEAPGSVRPMTRPLPKGWPSLAGQVETCFKITS